METPGAKSDTHPTRHAGQWVEDMNGKLEWHPDEIANETRDELLLACRAMVQAISGLEGTEIEYSLAMELSNAHKQGLKAIHSLSQGEVSTTV